MSGGGCLALCRQRAGRLAVWEASRLLLLLLGR